MLSLVVFIRNETVGSNSFRFEIEIEKCFFPFINYNLKFIVAPFPSNAPQRTYLPPSQQQQQTPSGSYGPPSQQQAPSGQYGAPQQQQFGSPGKGISQYKYFNGVFQHFHPHFYYFLRNFILNDLPMTGLFIFH